MSRWNKCFILLPAAVAIVLLILFLPADPVEAAVMDDQAEIGQAADDQVSENRASGDQAMKEPIVRPMWQNTSWTYTQLTFSSGGTAQCSAIIQGLPGTTRITAIVMLERRLADGTWYLVKVWRGVGVYGDLLTFDENWGPVVSGYTYRLTINAAVTRNGVVESVTSSDLTSY